MLFKKISIFSGILSLMLILSDLIFKISIKNINGIYLAFTALMLIVFGISLISFFVISDIAKNKFCYLKGINRVFLLVASALFLLGVIFKGYMYGVYSFYLLVFALINLILMTFIYKIKNTGEKKAFFKEWLFFISLIIIITLTIVCFSIFKK